ncbi:MAG: trigger factor [Alphaproteobacteria bacterium]|nr:trigger factor [Alphaproteobacteria bacterium]
MNITETKSEGLKKEYKVVIPATDIASKIDTKIKQIAKTAKLPGFRAGKAPFEMLKKKYHDSVLGEVIDDAIRSGTAELVKNENLRPAMQPEVKITSFADGKDLEFEVNLENLPEIKIGDFSKVKLDKFMAEVPAEEVEKALKYISESHKETVVAEGKKAAKGDVVMIDFVGSVDGVEFQGGKGTNYPLELGSGSFIPGFEDQLIGAEAGAKIDVNVKFPENYHAKDLAGKDALFVVDVKEVREPKVVELNDEFAKSVGAKSLDALKEDIKNRIKNDYENASRMKIKRQLLDALDTEYKFDSPESLVDAEYKSIVAQYEQAKKYNQLDASEKEKSEDELLKEYKDIALRRVKLGLLLSEVGQDAKISIKPEDINAAIMNEAKKYPGQEKAVLDYYLKNKSAVEALKAPIFEEKIVDYIISKADVSEKIVTVEELYNFNDEDKSSKKTSTKKTDKKSA